MGKGGKYLAKKVPVAKKKKKKILPIILIVIALIFAICIGGGILYYNYVLNMISRPDEITAESVALEETLPDETEGTTAPTSPEDTWPVVVSDKNITNIMLVGQAARAGEEARIADTMILCSINRETKTLTMTSFMRDLRLVWPEYVDYTGKVRTGNNRINMAYNMGYKWANENVKGGMDVLAGIVEYNFGVPVDHTIEVNFEIFEEFINKIGGVEVDISQEELKYLQDNYYNYFDDKSVGVNKLNGYPALCYARMRKVGHGDYERTERQREVITSIINKLKSKNILKINKIFLDILPMITTDMTNKEITNYALELIPMLKDVQIQSQRIPYDDLQTSYAIDMGDYTDYQLGCSDLKETGRRLRESIGMEEANAE